MTATFTFNLYILYICYDNGDLQFNVPDTQLHSFQCHACLIFPSPIMEINWRRVTNQCCYLVIVDADDVSVEHR